MLSVLRRMATSGRRDASRARPLVTRRGRSVGFALALLMGVAVTLSCTPNAVSFLVLPAPPRLGGSVSSQPPATLRYPDLRAVAPVDLGFDIQIIDGAVHHVLRFSTTVWNDGQGPLELRGDSSSGTTLVYQRVFDDRDQVTEFLAGTFVFHESHNHWHFENFGRYEIWTTDAYQRWVAGGGLEGAPAWISSKTTGQGESFCVRDSRPMSFTDAPPIRYTDCGQFAQGISAGWADIYSRDLPDQWVDVGEDPLPDGDYLLRIIADPLNLLYESPDKADPARESPEANQAITRFTVSNAIVTIVP